MSIINDDDFSIFNCDAKYLHTSSSISELVSDEGCEIEQLRNVWEEEIYGGTGLGSIGCINQYCCEAALYYVKEKYDYLVYFTLVAAILGFVNYGTLVSLISFLSLYTIKRIKHTKEEIVVGVLMALTILATIIFCIIGVSGPTFFPYLSTSVDSSLRPIYIEERFIEFDGYFDIFDIVIREDTSMCNPKCSQIMYSVDLTVSAGTVAFDDDYSKSGITILVDAVSGDSGYELKFEGFLADVNDGLSLLQYKPVCPFGSSNDFNVYITATPYGGSGSG
jgi:uncharacterized membrane protein